MTTQLAKRKHRHRYKIVDYEKWQIDEWVKVYKCKCGKVKPLTRLGGRGNEKNRISNLYRITRGKVGIRKSIERYKTP